MFQKGSLAVTMALATLASTPAADGLKINLSALNMSRFLKPGLDMRFLRRLSAQNAVRARKVYELDYNILEEKMLACKTVDEVNTFLESEIKKIENAMNIKRGDTYFSRAYTLTFNITKLLDNLIEFKKSHNRELTNELKKFVRDNIAKLAIGYRVDPTGRWIRLDLQKEVDLDLRFILYERGGNYRAIFDEDLEVEPQPRRPINPSDPWTLHGNSPISGYQFGTGAH